jgi:hypothetical protein
MDFLIINLYTCEERLTVGLLQRKPAYKKFAYHDFVCLVIFGIGDTSDFDAVCFQEILAVYRHALNTFCFAALYGMLAVHLLLTTVSQKAWNSVHRS